MATSETYIIQLLATERGLLSRSRERNSQVPPDRDGNKREKNESTYRLHHSGQGCVGCYLTVNQTKSVSRMFDGKFGASLGCIAWVWLVSQMWNSSF